MTSTATEHSEFQSAEVKEASVLTSIENKLMDNELDKEQDRDSGSGDDSDEEPLFPFGHRGKLVSQTVGDTSKAKSGSVRPPDHRGDNTVKEEEKLDELDQRLADAKKATKKGDKKGKKGK